MTDEVIFDNLDEAPEATEEAVAAVEALPEAGETEVSEEPAAEETAEQIETETSTDAAVESEQDERDAGTKAVEEFSKNLRTLEGKWYVLHTYSGYEKRVKTNEKARQRNKAIKSELRTHVRNFRTAVAEGDKAKAVELSRVANRALDKAVTKGVIHANQAANRKSAISLTVNTLD